MIFEVCVDNIETALAASKFRCHRVELCSALSVGGLTPSFGLIKACVEQTELEIHVMIRHEEGDFVCSESDLEIMKSDLLMAHHAGAKGIVFGCLTAGAEIDLEKSKALIDLAKSVHLQVTFHRAFDFVPEPCIALAQLIDLGVDRVLTSGQQPKAIDGIHLINELVIQSKNQIQIMAGSGVNAQNAVELASAGIDALHFTANLKVEGNIPLGMGQKSRPDELKIKSILNLFQ